MPKPIKKKLLKQTIIEENIETVFERIKETAQRRQQQIVIGAVIVILAIVSVIGTIIYKGNLRDRALQLEYEGYKNYTGLYQSVPVPEKERLEKALASFKEAYDIGGSPYSLYYIANCQYELEKYDEAILSLRELNQQFPDDERFVPLSYYKIALAALKTGNSEEALKALSVLGNYRTDSFKDLALMEAARILEQTGRTADALKRYEAVARSFQKSPFVEEAKLKAGIENVVEVPEQ